MHDNDSAHNILQKHEQHLLWQQQQQQQQQQQERIMTTNKLIKHFPQLQQRHSTGGIFYTQHPSAIAMMTLSPNNNKQIHHNYKNRAIDGFTMNYVTPVNVSGNSGALLTTRQRHQRDLFSGDIQQPPSIPPAPKNFLMAPMPPKRTHVGNVVHTFETMAAMQQGKQQQQNQTQQTFSKYLKNSTKHLTKFKKKITTTTTTTTTSRNKSTNQQQLNIQAHTTNDNNERKTFNDYNKQISQNFLINHQLELDYRKNLFSTKPTITQNHCTTNNHNNNYNYKITQFNNTNKSGTFSEWVWHGRQYDKERKAEDEAIIINFDEMLAGYSASDDDDDKNYGHNDNNGRNEMGENYDAHVSVINISGNDVKENNVLRINLVSTNDNTNSSGNKLMSLPATIEQQKQIHHKRILPIMRKKCTAPAPPQQNLQTKNTNKSKFNTQQHWQSQQQQIIPLSTATTKSILNKRAAENALVKVTMDIANPIKNSNNNNNNNIRDNFLHGSTLSQSFVRQKIKKQHAPPPPSTTPINKNNCREQHETTIKTTTRLTLTNPLSHVFKPKLKQNRQKTFNN